MIPTYQNLSQITLQDIEGLVEDRVTESSTLDFKREPRAPKEFSKLISSMANSEGGCIVVGVEEDQGCASAITGIDVNPDDFLLARNRSATSTIEPRIIIKTKVIEMVNGRKIVLFATPKSHNAPHMANGDLKRIYQRIGTATEVMEITEIRNRVMHSQTAEETALANHLQSLEGLKPLDIHEFYLVMTSNLPQGYGEIFDPSDREITNAVNRTIPTLSEGGRARHTFNGMQYHRGEHDRVTLHRNGDFILASFTELDHTDLKNKKSYLPSTWIRDRLYEWIQNNREMHLALGYEGEVFLCFTILGCSRKFLAVDNRKIRAYTDTSFSQEQLTMPVLTVNTNQNDWRIDSNLWLTRMWNAAGFEKCLDNGMIQPPEQDEDQGNPE